MRDRERQRHTQAEGEAGSMQGADVGLDPGSPGSHPGLKAVLNCWATGAARVLNSNAHQQPLKRLLESKCLINFLIVNITGHLPHNQQPKATKS